MNYDNYPNRDMNEDKKPEHDKCIHEFDEQQDIIRDYSPQLCTKVIAHGRSGLFIEGFAGKYNVCMDTMCKWLSNVKEYPEFNSAVKISISACIHYWNEELNHAITSSDWQSVTPIKGILSEIMKSTPKQLREGLFNNLINKSAEDIAREELLDNEKLLYNLTTGNNQ